MESVSSIPQQLGDRKCLVTVKDRDTRQVVEATHDQHMEAMVSSELFGKDLMDLVAKCTTAYDADDYEYNVVKLSLQMEVRLNSALRERPELESVLVGELNRLTEEFSVMSKRRLIGSAEGALYIAKFRALMGHPLAMLQSGYVKTVEQLIDMPSDLICEDMFTDESYNVNDFATVLKTGVTPVHLNVMHELMVCPAMQKSASSLYPLGLLVEATAEDIHVVNQHKLTRTVVNGVVQFSDDMKPETFSLRMMLLERLINGFDGRYEDGSTEINPLLDSFTPDEKVKIREYAFGSRNHKMRTLVMLNRSFN